MHCVSAYPCPYKIMNLNNINVLEKKFRVPIGLSDHTPSIYNSLGAVSLGASLIEKHFTFNKNKAVQIINLLSMDQFLKDLIQGVKQIFLARGSEKKIFNEEKEIVNWAREGVVTIKSIKKKEKKLSKIIFP